MGDVQKANINLRAEEEGKEKMARFPLFFLLPMDSFASSSVTRVSRLPLFATKVRKTKRVRKRQW